MEEIIVKCDCGAEFNVSVEGTTKCLKCSKDWGTAVCKSCGATNVYPRYPARGNIRCDKCFETI